MEIADIVQTHLTAPPCNTHPQFGHNRGVSSTSGPAPTAPSANLVGASGVRQGSKVVIIGGGPGGYEAALVASQLGAQVTLVEDAGCGGNAVLTDVVPSKTLIATANVMAQVQESHELGIELPAGDALTVDLARLGKRVKELAAAQSRDIHQRLEKEGITVIDGRGFLDADSRVVVHHADGKESALDTDIVLLAVGASPRELPSAMPDGERILTWKQVYDIDHTPEHLIVVGSGVTGAEFAGAYDALGVDVTLVSSRDMVLPGEDPDAAEVLEAVFRRRGMEILNKVRAQSVTRHGEVVRVELSDGRTIEGSHCLMAVGAIPNTQNLGLADAGVETTDSGHIVVDRVSRTTNRKVYAAGDCTGVFPLASVAAMQGRIAMWHALGDAVSPLDLNTVSSNVFTSPEIATVGITQAEADEFPRSVCTMKLPFSTNPRAKMQGNTDGFVKIFCRKGTGTVLGGVVVSRSASELIHTITVAVQSRLTVDEVAGAFTIYPSLSGSIAEAARQLHHTPEV